VKLSEALRDVERLFLDTAPVIYYVEKNPLYLDTVMPFFDRIDIGQVTAVTSPVTLAECLVMPYRLGRVQLQRDFEDLIVYGYNTVFVPLDHENARYAAELRARYNITLSDAIQVAVALSAGCEAFLTNDGLLSRVREVRVLVLNELELDPVVHWEL
jgi:predicted nucleic acid-binding protein